MTRSPNRPQQIADRLDDEGMRHRKPLVEWITRRGWTGSGARFLQVFLIHGEHSLLMNRFAPTTFDGAPISESAAGMRVAIESHQLCDDGNECRRKMHDERNLMKNMNGACHNVTQSEKPRLARMTNANRPARRSY